MVDWFTATVYFYSEGDDRKFKIDLTEHELAKLLKFCDDLNKLYEFTELLNRWEKIENGRGKKEKSG